MFMSAKKVSPNAENDYDVPDIFKISHDMMKVTDGFGAGWSFARIESEGHLNVIKALHEQNPTLTLKKLVGSDKNGRYALLWMARNTNFVLAVFKELLKNRNSSKELVYDDFLECYERTLRKHHSWAYAQPIYLAFNNVHYRKDLMKILFDDNYDDAEIEERLALIQRFLNVIQEFLGEKID